MYTTAGLLGHTGLNEAGVGVCANFVDDPGGWGEGLPRYLLSRLALREKTVDAALEAALRPPRAASRNLLIADATGAFVDAELLRREVGPHPRGATGSWSMPITSRRPSSRAGRRRRRTPLKRRERLETLERRRRTHRRRRRPAVLSRPRERAAQPLAPTRSPDAMSRRWSRSSATSRGSSSHAAKGAPCRAVFATYTVATCRQGALSVTARDAYAPHPTVAS